jgi:chromosome segregation ATPase
VTTEKPKLQGLKLHALTEALTAAQQINNRARPELEALCYYDTLFSEARAALQDFANEEINIVNHLATLRTEEERATAAHAELLSDLKIQRDQAQAETSRVVSQCRAEAAAASSALADLKHELSVTREQLATAQGKHREFLESIGLGAKR